MDNHHKCSVLLALCISIFSLCLSDAAYAAPSELATGDVSNVMKDVVKKIKNHNQSKSLSLKTPTSILFDRQQQTIFDVSLHGLSDEVSGDFLYTIDEDDTDLFVMNWANGRWGERIGESNIIVDDLNGNGYLELIVGASWSGAWDDYWYIVGYNEESSLYQQIWLSKSFPINPNLTTSIARIIVLDPDGSGKRIYVAASDGTLYVYSIWPVVLETTASIPLEVTDMVAGDLDQDGIQELILSTGTYWTPGSLYIYDATTLEQRVQWLGLGAPDIAVGQLDSDTSLEIVTASTPGRVIDGHTGEIEWSYDSGFGVNVEVGNLEKGPIQEFVAAESWYSVTAFSAELKTSLWEISTQSDIGAINLVDVTGNAREELLIAEGQWGNVLVYDSATQKLIASISNPEHGVTDVNAGDFDQDGIVEVVWGAGANSTGPDILAVASLETELIEWSSFHILEPLAQVDVGDIDADGELEVVMASFDTDGDYEGVIFIFDAISHSLEWRIESTMSPWDSIHQLRVGNLDEDEQLEIVIGTSQNNNGVIKVYDGLTHELQLQTDPSDYFFTSVTSLELADADADGEINIVAGLGAADEYFIPTGIYVLVFDPLTGEELWRSINLSASGLDDIYDVEVANLDDDVNPEIIASIAGESVWVFDGVTKDLEWTGNPCPAKAVHAFDADGDSDIELIVGCENGQISAYDPKIWQIEWSVYAGGRINALKGLVSEFNNRLILFSDRTKLRALNGENFELLDVSEYLGANLGLGNHLPIADPDEDSATNIWVGSNYALFEFEEYLETLPHAADLSVTLNDIPDPVYRGTELSYIIEVMNTGPESAENVEVELVLASGLYIHSVESEECEYEDNEVECKFEQLAAGDSVSITVFTFARQPGEHMSTATVNSEYVIDPDLTNNNYSEVTTVLRPTNLTSR